MSYERNVAWLTSEIEKSKDSPTEAEKMRGVVASILISNHVPSYVFVRLAETVLQVMKEDYEIARSLGDYLEEANDKMNKAQEDKREQSP